MNTHERLTAMALGAVTTLILSLTPPWTVAADAAGALPPSAAVPPQVAASATAVGPLAPSGCTRSASYATDHDVTCSLTAMEGTTSLLGTSIPIWGFSTSGEAGSATAPGPVLVVNEGDHLTVSFANKLSQEVSLAFPGQQVGAFSHGPSVADETQGVAGGSSDTYAFTASRAGTFVYEAGHTANGARQVAMGLAGALVVLPSGGAGSAYGQAYDDESVLVLSEIDPALNTATNPMSFDMRYFQARYRLINGKPFPETTPIATAPGHGVLLRYVNAGSASHAMTLLGANQLELAEDGHALSHPVRQVVASVRPGATLDSLVTMPAGSGGKVTLYESGAKLDNDGRTTATDPGQIALGGMMTFLDTEAAPPTGDVAGPVSRHIKATPNPSDATSDVTVTADLTDLTGVAGDVTSDVTSAEFLVDDSSVAVGGGLPMTGGSFGTPTVTGASGTLPAGDPADCTAPGVPLTLACLSAGKHHLYVRALDSSGNWGAIGSTVLDLPKLGPLTRGGAVDPNPTNASGPAHVSATGDASASDGTISAAEYFVDDRMAVRTTRGTAMTLNNNNVSVVAESADIPKVALDGLVEGPHTVSVRSQDGLGLWGPMHDIPLYVDHSGPAVKAVAVAPNPTNKLLTSSGDPGNLVVSADLEDRDSSVLDSNNKPAGQLQSKIVEAEGFVDCPTKHADMTEGKGFGLMATDGAFDSTSESVYGLIPISALNGVPDGTCHVFVSGRDASGNWSESREATDLVVDTAGPALANLRNTTPAGPPASSVTLTADITGASPFMTAEFWTGNTDPGRGAGASVPVAAVGTTVVFTVPTTGIRNGNVQFNVRVRDNAGNWSNAVSRTVNVPRQNALFSTAFSALSGLSAQTGQVTTAPRVGTPDAAGSRGLQATLPGGRRNRAAYVTDGTPAADPTYLVGFDLRPGTLRSGSSRAVSVLTALAPSGKPAFRVELRRPSGRPQVRTIMMQSHGGPVAGGWRTVSPRWHAVRVSWVAGGAGTGSLAMTLDGVTRFQRSGDTSALPIESVRLGIVSGFTRTSKGSVFFDNFRSARHELP